MGQWRDVVGGTGGVIVALGLRGGIGKQVRCTVSRDTKIANDRSSAFAYKDAVYELVELCFMMELYAQRLFFCGYACGSIGKGGGGGSSAGLLLCWLLSITCTR